jgi:hypothetical protein
MALCLLAILSRQQRGFGVLGFDGADELYLTGFVLVHRRSLRLQDLRQAYAELVLPPIRVDRGRLVRSVLDSGILAQRTSGQAGTRNTAALLSIPVSHKAECPKCGELEQHLVSFRA